MVKVEKKKAVKKETVKRKKTAQVKSASKKKPIPKKPAKKKAPAKKKKAGRPSLYKPEYVQTLIDFCDQPPYEDVKINHYGKDGELKWTDIKRMPNPLPTLVGFSRLIGVGLRTLYDWIDPDHSSYKPEFSHAYTHIAKALQKDFLIQNGLQGLYNPVAFKFTAVNMTDMKDTKEVEGNDEKPILLKVVYD